MTNQSVQFSDASKQRWSPVSHKLTLDECAALTCYIPADLSLSELTLFQGVFNKLMVQVSEYPAIQLSQHVTKSELALALANHVMELVDKLDMSLENVCWQQGIVPLNRERVDITRGFDFTVQRYAV